MQRPIRPFLKWAGGKLRITGTIRERLPEGSRLVEPFVGSGAVFLNTDYRRYLLTDTNADLINLYRAVKRDCETLIARCRVLFTEKNNTPERYYTLRDRFNGTDDVEERSALFIYLNRHGYNGLCRYNASGGFNVPFGRYRRPYFPENEMRLFAVKAKRATFRTEGFERTMRVLKRGDVVYADPPYVPLSSSANFTAYSAGGFGMEEQGLLAKLAQAAADTGIPVLISNHDTPFTRAAYAKAALSELAVRRNISCNVLGRGKAQELLALFT